MSVKSPPARGSKSRVKPRLAITVGDVAGVGPEIALACAADESVLARCHPILIGPATAMRMVGKTLSLPIPAVTTHRPIDGPERHPIRVDRLRGICRRPFVAGQFSSQTGQASFLAVDFAIRQTLAGVFDAIVTGPIQKEAWHAAATGYLGHTELLADRTGTTEFCMMLSGESCSTVLATIHLPLVDAIAALSVETIVRAIRLGGSAMETRHGRPPRITVLGLNPHAGKTVCSATARKNC